MTKLYNKFAFPETENIWPKDDAQKPSLPPYIFSNEIKTIIKVALVTERPLLITGSPGSGKTSLAKSIAAFQEWNYLKYTFTSRSRLEELTGEIDQLQRLHDAHRTQDNDALMEEWAYYKPGVFWWAFDQESAGQKGKPDEELPEKLKPEPPTNFNNDRKGCVILLDEIDKAEPDLPNDLLEPLDRLSFQLPHIEPVIAKGLPPLVIITSNGERDLPDAFLRRCIALHLPDPSNRMLVTIAEHHFDKTDDETENLYTALAEKFTKISEEAKELQQRQPGTSEYLDAVKACMELGITPDEADTEEETGEARTPWQLIKNATLRKKQDQGEED